MSKEAKPFNYATFGEVSSGSSGRKESEAESSQARGYAIGFAQGIRAAESAAREQRQRHEQAAKAAEAAREEQHRATLRALTAALDAVEAAAAPTIDQASTILIESALQLTEQLLGKSLEDAPFAARTALERAMKAREPVNPVRAIRMNPQDLQTLRFSTVPDTEITLIPDESLSPGDAVADCERGFIDARISSAFQRASQALRSEHR